MDVSVLIVGGGTCGLSASIFLSDLGIDHLLVERHTSTSHAPKAHYINQRTMEIFRQHGFAETVAARAASVEEFGKVCWQTSLAGPEPYDAQVVYEMDAFGGGALRESYAAAGPILPANLPQVRLEPLMRTCAERRAPGRVQFGRELLEFHDTGDRIIALIADPRTGERQTVRARYLIGADAGKTVGPGLGVRLEGFTGLAPVVTAHFRADLSRWVQDNTLITWLTKPEQDGLLRAALVAMGPTWGKGSEEWALYLTYDPDDRSRFDRAAVAARIRETLGLPELSLELLGVNDWELEAVLADRYQAGNVFLAGDAAHRHPPATGLGMNTAVQDAHNLVWKIAMVLTGQAGAELLSSYETERRPVGRRNVDWAMSASVHHQVITEAALGIGSHMPAEMSTPTFIAYFQDSPIGATIRARAAEIFRTNRTEVQAHDLELGFAYDDGALVPDGRPAPPRAPMGDVYAPTTRPGHRLPHAWLGNGGGRASTHDFTGAGTAFALLAGPDGDSWCDAAEQVAAKFGVTIRAVRIGRDWTDLDGTWARVRGIADDGAVLVRPDNHVAWRTAATDEAPLDTLETVLRTVLYR